ncbi:MAG: beta-N-acetylhexosaminidase [Myxococcota bacterium]
MGSMGSMGSMAYGEQTTLWDRKRRAGQRLVVSLPGPRVNDEVRWLCQETAPAGFILFSRNIEEPEQIYELNRELTSLLPDSLPPLLCVDQEGGRVQRLRGTDWPAARWLGNLDDPQATRRVASRLGAELASVGFNICLAPVADVADGPAEGPIGDRSFSGDPDRCARHVVAFLSGLRHAGVGGMLKHFPGLGLATVDSHEALPDIELDRPDLERRDLTPFRAAMAAGANAVMAAHARYPAYDEDWPASLSPRLLQGLLRRDMSFEGVIMTDDLEMGALKRWSLEERVMAAVQADADLLLFCGAPTRPLEAFERLIRIQEDDPASTAFQDSARRLMRLREETLLGRPTPMPFRIIGNPQHRDLAMLIRARGGA